MSAARGWQTLGQVSEQMGSLLYRQSSQRVLPDEPCLLKRTEFRVTSESNKVRTFHVGAGDNSTTGLRVNT